MAGIEGRKQGLRGTFRLRMGMAWGLEVSSTPSSPVLVFLQAGIYCSNNCKCNECKNFEGSTIRAAVLASMDQREIVEAGKRAAAGGGLAGSHKRHRVMESRPMQMPLHVPMPVSVAQVCGNATAGTGLTTQDAERNREGRGDCQGCTRGGWHEGKG